MSVPKGNYPKSSNGDNEVNTNTRLQLQKMTWVELYGNGDIMSWKHDYIRNARSNLKE